MAGFLSRVRSAWNGLWEAPAPPPPPEQIRFRKEEFAPPNGSDVLPVAARGDVFELHLVPYFHWSSEAMTFEKLTLRSLQYVEPARGRLLREVWRTAREFGPTELLAAEKAISELETIREGWCYEDEAGTIRCKPTVRVLLDPRLRDQLLPIELRRIEREESIKVNRSKVSEDFELSKSKAEQAHELNKSKARYAEELTGDWLMVIKRLEELQLLGPDERQFLVPFAASLSDRDFAIVMHELASQRRAKATDLVGVLQQAAKNHEGVGLFEFARAYDLAVQAYSKQLGLGPHRWNLNDVNPAGQQ